MSDDAFPLDAEGLDRYLAGEASPADVAAIEAWVGGSAERRVALEAMRASARGETVQPKTADVDAAWGAARQRLGLTGDRATRIRERQRRVVGERAGYRLGLRRWAMAMRVAAALVIAAGGLLLWRESGHRAVPVTEREFAAAASERTSVTLEDGTQVVLAPGSRVRVPGTYGRGARDVYLDGQAYFSVVHDARLPFAVHAGNAVIRDIGTRFGVRAYREDARVRVVVADGVVALGDSTIDARPRAARLTAGMLGEVDRFGAVDLTASVDTALYLSWTTGRLVFRGTPLREALPELGRWYDLDIRVEGTVPDSMALTAAFGTEPVADALAALGVALDMRVERAGRDVKLIPLQRAR